LIHISQRLLGLPLMLGIAKLFRIKVCELANVYHLPTLGVEYHEYLLDVFLVGRLPLDLLHHN